GPSPGPPPAPPGEGRDARRRRNRLGSLRENRRRLRGRCACLSCMLPSPGGRGGGPGGGAGGRGLGIHSAGPVGGPPTGARGRGDLKRELAAGVARTIGERFGVDHDPVIEVPPRRELGDLASPAALQLARTLKRKPREIAQELAEAFPRPAGVQAVTVEGAGY